MSQEYQPRHRRQYYIAEADEVGRPHWEDSYDGQMLYGIAYQELIDGVDWMTYRLLLTEELGFFDMGVRSEEGLATELEYVSSEQLLQEVKK